MASIGASLDDLLDDLDAEYGALDAVVAGLDDEAWSAPTAAPGWAVRHQVTHLAQGEQLAALAATDPDGFSAELSRLLGDLAGVLADTDRRAAEAPAVLLASWREARRGLLDALRGRDGAERIQWVSGPMSARSFATSRLMETWAHGWDVAHGLGVHLAPTARLRHVAHLGVATRGHSFANRGLERPAGEVRVELLGPDGDVWTWGPADAVDRVRGPAEDFCLLVARRRHRADTDLIAEGGADAWLAVAQVFAGPPSDPPPPGG